MNLLFRLFWAIFAARWRQPVPSLGPCDTPFVVLPTDLDLLRHMNNGRYFSLMDVARVDLMARSGLWPQLKALGWYPVVVHETIMFHKSLKLGQRYDIRTTVVAWDAQHFLMTQDFISQGSTAARAVVKARMLKRSGGSVSSAELLALTGTGGESPQTEPWIAQWSAAHDAATAARKRLAAG
jgi:acyl-CoA thioesterase FadM